MQRVNWINTDQSKGFEVENLRKNLAKDQKYKKLKKTYNKKYAEIKNLNTKSLWDKLNNQTTLDSVKKKSFMAFDRLNIVHNLLEELHPVEVLNSGFGSGVLEEKILSSSNHFKWYGVDFSPESLEKVKLKFKDKGEFKLSSVQKLPYKDSSFDCIVMLEVIEHIQPRNTLKVLAEQKRVLKKGGHIIISVPMNEGLKELVLSGENPNAHVRTYTEDLISAELIMSGFTIIKKESLTAFSSFYYIKKLISKIVKNKWHKNNVIVLAQK